MPMHYRVSYVIEGKTMACEYPTKREAEIQATDIEGYGFPCTIEPRHEGQLRQGPFEVKEEVDPSLWQRLTVTG